ncbi:MAG: precorrin-3B synthase [Polyangiaceae bacterium]
MKSSTEERFHRRGWCPRVWTPMESGDGFLVRVQAGWRARSSADVRALAKLARAYGNGQLEITRRANWQLRGVTSANLSSVQGALVSRGLAAPSDAPLPAASLLVNPLSGLDPACAPLDAMAAEIERVLRSEKAPRDLPDKFSVVLDGGGDVLRDVASDLRIDVRTTSPGVAFLGAGAREDRASLLGACRVEDVAAALFALLDLASRGPNGPRRMRDVIDVERVEGVREVIASLVLADRQGPTDVAAAPSVVGFHGGISGWIGLGLPFGSGDVRQWNAIADIAERYGDGSVRLTPRRSVVIADVATANREAALTIARACDLVVDESDPRLRINACVGAPFCSAARGETRRIGSELGSLLAPLLSAGGTLHVSGCNKSCAHGGASSVTVVCHERGFQVQQDGAVADTTASDVLDLEATRRLVTAVAADFATAGHRS